MAKSKLIKDLATSSISIEEAMNRLLIVVYDLNLNHIIEWINNEITGYSQEEKLPEYREDLSCQITYSGFHGRSTQVTNITLPRSFVPEKIHNIFVGEDVREGINIIEKSIKDKSSLTIDLTDFSGIVLQHTGSVRCSKIVKEINSIGLEHVITMVKNRVLFILLELERKFGNLDELDLDSQYLTDEETDKLEKQFTNKIYFDNNKENL